MGRTASEHYQTQTSRFLWVLTSSFLLFSYGISFLLVCSFIWFFFFFFALQINERGLKKRQSDLCSARTLGGRSLAGPGGSCAESNRKRGQKKFSFPDCWPGQVMFTWCPISSRCHLLSLVSWIINYISITCHSMYEASGGLAVGENGAGWTAVKRTRRKGKTIFQAKSEHLDLSSNSLPGSTAGCYSGQLCDTAEFWCCFSAVMCVIAQIISKCCEDFAATRAQLQ